MFQFLCVVDIALCLCCFCDYLSMFLFFINFLCVSQVCSKTLWKQIEQILKFNVGAIVLILNRHFALGTLPHKNFQLSKNKNEISKYCTLPTWSKPYIFVNKLAWSSMSMWCPHPSALLLLVLQSIWPSILRFHALPNFCVKGSIVGKNFWPIWTKTAILGLFRSKRTKMRVSLFSFANC